MIQQDDTSTTIQQDVTSMTVNTPSISTPDGGNSGNNAGQEYSRRNRCSAGCIVPIGSGVTYFSGRDELYEWVLSRSGSKLVTFTKC